MVKVTTKQVKIQKALHVSLTLFHCSFSVLCLWIILWIMDTLSCGYLCFSLFTFSSNAWWLISF